MPASIGVNLRVTGHCRQGGRKYMEDFFSVAYQQTEDERDLEYAFFGIYDGHGGAEAAAFAKEHLMETIIKHKSFWSDNDEDVLRAIKDGYIATHYAMWKEQEKWPKTASGLPSTAGTTASVAFIRRGKIYIGHVGDSGIILGYQENGCTEWKAKPLTRDHKPENLDEMTRINQCGGKVVSKSGVPRVVWNRPKMGHQGPVRRSTPIDEIPFLAVARSLGDLWSYNSQINQFIVSPDPDCSVIQIDTTIHRCLIFGTDGLFNMLTPHASIHIVQQAERHNEMAALSDCINKTWLNPSKLLVEKALERWHNTKMRADNTSVVTLMLDPPGPPRAQVLRNRKEKQTNYPDSGLKIMTRYEDQNKCTSTETCTKTTDSDLLDTNTIDNINDENQNEPCSSSENSSVTSTEPTLNFLPLKERNFTSKPRESTSFDTIDKENVDKENLKAVESVELGSIQINEISSSVNDDCNDDTNDENHHNLRSTTNKQQKLNCERITRTKRKLETNNSVHNLRKSSRIDCIQKKAAMETTKMNERNVKKPMNIAQKILKSKKLNLKKKTALQKPINKKKILAVLANLKTTKHNEPLENVVKTKIKSKIKTKTMKKDKIEVELKRQVQSRSSIRRQSKRNLSSEGSCTSGKIMPKIGEKVIVQKRTLRRKLQQKTSKLLNRKK